MLRLLLIAAMIPLSCGGAGKKAIDADQIPTQDTLEQSVEPDITDDPADTAAPPDMTLFDVPVETVTDILQPDMATDQTPDVVQFENAAFRVDWLAVEYPDLCYPTPAGCVSVVNSVNAGLQDQLAAGKLTLLGLFEPFGGNIKSTLTFGAGNCDTTKSPILCAFDPLKYPATFEDVPILTSVKCNPGNDLEPFASPCFVATGADMALELSGVVLGLSDATLCGTVKSWPPNAGVKPGLIRGYLPESMAKSIQISIPVGEMPIVLTLYELLAGSGATPKEVNGHPAWEVRISFTASQVAMQD